MLPKPVRIPLLLLLTMGVAACSGEEVPSATPESATTTSTTATTSTSTTSTTIPPATTSTSTTSTTSSTSTSTTTSTSTSTTSSTTTSVAPATGSIYDIRPPSDLPAPPLPDGWVTQAIGTSVEGREITALIRPVEAPAHTLLVVGGIHGNEPASPPTVRAMVTASFADDVEVWLVPELNPDGVAAGTRWNAAGVDLNRNFSWDWRPDDGGDGPISEPETHAITTLVSAIAPDLAVWVHQPYGYVSSVGPTTDRSFESAWSDGSGLPTRSGVTQHGGGESWTVFEAATPAMLIEIDTWSATEEVVDAQLAGFQALLASLGWDG